MVANTSREGFRRAMDISVYSFIDARAFRTRFYLRDFVDTFNARFAIPKGLAEMGVTEDRIDDLVAMALEDPSCGGNPVTLTTDNLTALFKAAM